MRVSSVDAILRFAETLWKRHYRQYPLNVLQVDPKRTNVPGMTRGRGRGGPRGGRGFGGGRGGFPPRGGYRGGYRGGRGRGYTPY